MYQTTVHVCFQIHENSHALHETIQCKINVRLPVLPKSSTWSWLWRNTLSAPKPGRMSGNAVSWVVNERFGRKLSCCTGNLAIFSSASSFSFSNLGCPNMPLGRKGPCGNPFNQAAAGPLLEDALLRLVGIPLSVPFWTGPASSAAAKMRPVDSDVLTIRVTTMIAAAIEVGCCAVSMTLTAPYAVSMDFLSFCACCCHGVSYFYRSNKPPWCPCFESLSAHIDMTYLYKYIEIHVREFEKKSQSIVNPKSVCGERQRLHSLKNRDPLIAAPSSLGSQSFFLAGGRSCWQWPSGARKTATSFLNSS